MGFPKSRNYEKKCIDVRKQIHVKYVLSKYHFYFNYNNTLHLQFSNRYIHHDFINSFSFPWDLSTLPL